MRYVHEIIDDLRPSPDENLAPIGAALKELLGGQRGTLADLTDRFTEAGLGHIIASWMGKGPELPISTQDLRAILGDERVGDFATLAGLSSEDFLVHFARILPGAVRRLTSEGQIDTPP